MHILFVFIDGIGLGAAPDRHNPLSLLSLPALEQLAGGQPWTAAALPLCSPGHTFHGIDATLGIAGLPQSGTGQATLFTGVNAAALAGRHFGPYPHSQTKPLLASQNIFLKVQQLGIPFEQPAAFANAYPPRFFAYVQERNRWTVTTLCCLGAGVPILGEEALVAGKALSADLTGAGWSKMGLNVPEIPEREAGKNLYRMSRRHAFTLFEYYLTDKVGHSRSSDRAETVLQALDRFFAGILTHFDLEDSLLLIASDHGNIEDLSTKSHTYNHVPLIALGRNAGLFCNVRDLTGVTPAILQALAAPNHTP